MAKAFCDLELQVENLQNWVSSQKETIEFLRTEIQKQNQRLFDIEKRETVRQTIQKEEGNIEYLRSELADQRKLIGDIIKRETVRQSIQKEEGNIEERIREMPQPDTPVFPDGRCAPKDDRLQKLVDICFALVLTTQKVRNAMAIMTQDELMTWVSYQLKACGFPTKPRGASWGVLE